MGMDSVILLIGVSYLILSDWLLKKIFNIEKEKNSPAYRLGSYFCSHTPKIDVYTKMSGHYKNRLKGQVPLKGWGSNYDKTI